MVVGGDGVRRSLACTLASWAASIHLVCHKGMVSGYVRALLRPLTIVIAGLLVARGGLQTIDS